MLLKFYENRFAYSKSCVERLFFLSDSNRRTTWEYNASIPLEQIKSYNTFLAGFSLKKTIKRDQNHTIKIKLDYRK